MRTILTLTFAAAALSALVGCNLKFSSSSDGSSAQSDDSADSGEPTREVAGGGVGRRGHVEDRSVVTQPLTTPVNAYFNAKHRITFIQIQREVDLQKQLNGGVGLKSYEELEEKVIRPIGVRLPELPPGDKYVFDVGKQQLMVEHPPR